MQKTAEKHLRVGISIGLPLANKPTPSGLKIVDRAGQAVAWFYTDKDARRRTSGGLLEPRDAERVAKICARAVTAALKSDD
ncbi:MAG: hypothetical protein OEL78_09155 [Hyphomicrobiales bacterium]|nr:hypothetical protein [Hyphomicrobiales bacterium]